MADGEVRITVRDQGRWREGTRAEGGRGIILMRALMDEVDVVPGAEGTVVRMRRRIGDSAGPEAGLTPDAAVKPTA
jgi:anti-sigma regulatory factor (Ser/Thr protein kinase)